MTKTSKTKSKKFYISIAAIAIVIAAIVVAVVVLCNMETTCADKTFFTLTDKWEVNIKGDKLVYNESTGNDVLQVHLVAKNVSQEDYSFLDEQGYDEDAPTADQFTEDDAANMTEEEINEINKQTILKYGKENAYKATPLANAIWTAKQDDKNCKESTIERNDGTTSNSESFGDGVKSGHEKDFYIAYELNTANDVLLTVTLANSDGVSSDADERIDINFHINGRTSQQKAAANSAEQKEIQEKSKLETVDFATLTITLDNDWYCDQQGVAAAKFKNKNNSGTIDINNHSSQTASEAAQQTSGWFGGAQITQTSINGTPYYKFLTTSGDTMLCADYKSSQGSFRIYAKSVSDQDLEEFIKNIEIK